MYSSFLVFYFFEFVRDSPCIREYYFVSSIDTGTKDFKVLFIDYICSCCVWFAFEFCLVLGIKGEWVLRECLWNVVNTSLFWFTLSLRSYYFWILFIKIYENHLMLSGTSEKLSYSFFTSSRLFLTLFFWISSVFYLISCISSFDVLIIFLAFYGRLPVSIGFIFCRWVLNRMYSSI